MKGQNIMKRNPRLRSILAICALLSLPIAAHAQEQGQAATKPITQEAIAMYRSQWMEVAALFAQLAERSPDPQTSQLAIELMRQARQLSNDDLALFVSAGVDMTELVSSTRRFQHIVESSDLQPRPKSPGFPDADYTLFCGSDRPDPLVVLAAQGALEAAKLVWSTANRTCNQTVVVLGEGGNTSLVCTIADGIFYAVEALLNAYINCRENINTKEIEGSYDRLGHLHVDLEETLATDTQLSIEQNLMLAAPTQNVVTFMLPAAFGGQLETVAMTVQNAMTNAVAAGESINFAQTFFDQAEALAATTDYKRAYLMYKRAYQEIAKLP
jgi:preprotein translocase subunit SecE